MVVQLKDRVVLITGAARGIGAETARQLESRGARLALVDVDGTTLAALAAELDERHVCFTADVTDQASMNAAVTSTVEQLGGIDVVIANAGVASYGTVRQVDPAAFARTIDINLTGVFRTAHASIPHVIERKGYVLIVASLASFTPLGGLSAYCASKAGVESFARAFRMEVAHLGVGVGIAHPSWIDTDLVRGADADLPTFKKLRGKLPWPANSTTTVEECAEALVRGIEKRAARIYVPGSVAMVNALRAAIGGSLAERATRRTAAALIPDLEADVTALGRSFATHIDRPGPAR